MRRAFLAILFAAIAGGLAGCHSSSAGRNPHAVRAYYAYDFPAARDALRDDAAQRTDEQVVLNNVRLGLAAMADGDHGEAENALLAAYELLSTAGLNADRTTAAAFFNESIRIWKGEPFEQALAYYAVAAHYASRGDWENARAAAANSLFRLRDFGADQNAETLARRAAADDTFLDEGYEPIETTFALGYLMQAIGAERAGASNAGDLYTLAQEIDPALAPLIETLRSGDFDTLLLVDYGKGPTKQAYGRDDALVHFVVQEPVVSDLTVDGAPGGSVTVPPACDVNAMAIDYRWNNLEDVRRAKSFFGDALIVGGLVVANNAGRSHEVRDGLIGAGMVLAGLLSKSNAQADTRYLEFAPQSIYVVPLRLEDERDLTVRIGGVTTTVLPAVAPGTTDQPRTIYLRLHGHDTVAPRWLTAGRRIYGHGTTGVRPGDFPWILGGRDVSAPTRDTLESYQAHGFLLDFTVADLRALYDAEGIVIGPRPRHILEGGDGLFDPAPDSIGARRLFGRDHPPYTPRSSLVRDVAEAVRDPN